VTLVPPVNVNVAAVDEAVDVVRAGATAARGPLELEIGPAATFAPLTPVLYLQVGGDVEGLSAMRQAVLKGPLERPAEWPFVAHVTIAGEQAAERLAAGVSALADYRAAVTIDRLHLLQEGDDRVWRPLADASFGPPVVIGRGGLPVELSVTENLEPEAERFLNSVRRQQEPTAAGSEAVARPFAVTARREGAVVAVAVGYGSTEAFLRRLVVAPEARRQGLGSQVLAAVEHWATTHGCRRVLAVVPDHGLAASFFRERGWTVERTLPAWRGGGDFLRLVRELVPA
jgi:GNAT superfamily N-acetyltransferase